MDLENYIRKAYLESYRGKREGDREEEVEAIKNYILNSKKVAIATNNINKFSVIRDTLIENVYKDREVDIFKVDIPT